MWNEPSQERLARIPSLYETETIPIEDKIIHLHFFIGGCDWYIAEHDGDDIFYGYAILNGNMQNGWGNGVKSLTLTFLLATINFLSCQDHFAFNIPGLSTIVMPKGSSL